MSRLGFMNKTKDPPDFRQATKDIIIKIEGQKGQEIFNNLPSYFFEGLEAFQALFIKEYKEYKSNNQTKLFYIKKILDLLKFTNQNDGYDKYRCPLCGFASTENYEFIYMHKPIMKQFFSRDINFAMHSALYGYEIDKKLNVSYTLSSLVSPINEFFHHLSSIETKNWKVYKKSAFHNLQVVKKDEFELLFDHHQIGCYKQNKILLILLERTDQKEYSDTIKCLKQKQYANTKYITSTLYKLSKTHFKEMIEFASEYQEECQDFCTRWKNIVNKIYEQHFVCPYIPSDPQQQITILTRQNYIPAPIINRKTENTEKEQEVDTQSSYQELNSPESPSFVGQTNSFLHNEQIDIDLSNNFESTALSLPMSQEVGEVTKERVNENDLAAITDGSFWSLNLNDCNEFWLL